MYVRDPRPIREIVKFMRRKIAVTVGLLTWSCGADVPPSDTAAADAPAAVSETVDSRPAVLFLGTSLTAGLGVAVDSAFPALIGKRIDSLNVPLRVVNAGESGGTSAGGLRRIEFLLEQQEVAVLVLELGANDGLRGLDVEAMRANLQAIIDRARAAYPDVDIVLAGMEAPPNLGVRYTEQFRQTFVDLAAENDAALVPFLLEGVGAVESMNQDDGIHPNEQGHRQVADNVWAVLQDVVRDRSRTSGVP